MQQDPLQALHPLREPSPVGWWPPAPGWWLLAVATLIVVSLTLAWFWRQHQRQRYRRQAEAELHALREAGIANHERIQSTNAILKRAALSTYSARRVAPLAGNEWIDFLDSTLPAKHRTFTAFSGDIFYAPTPEDGVADAYIAAAMVWMRHHRRGTGDA